jgi:hypothetical protein
VNGLVAVAGQPFKDGSASRIGESLEEAVCSGVGHTLNHNQLVMVCQEKITHAQLN